MEDRDTKYTWYLPYVRNYSCVSKIHGISDSFLCFY